MHFSGILPQHSKLILCKQVWVFARQISLYLCPLYEWWLSHGLANDLHFSPLWKIPRTLKKIAKTFWEEFKFRGRYYAAFVFANGTLSTTLNEFIGIRKAFDESLVAGIRNPASGIRNFEIWNFEIWNPVTYGIRNPRSCNLESKTLLYYLT